MRAWTIVLFIIAIHACLTMVNTANITNVGLNVTLDTSSKSGTILVSPGNSSIQVPSSDPRFFDQNASPNNVNVNQSVVLTRKDFLSQFITSILGVGDAFFKLMEQFSAAIFSIHTLGAPLFGDMNAWILEGMVDLVFGISLFQMVTGRSFKTME